MDSTTRAAFQAISQGFQAIPIMPRSKKPIGANWQHRKWPDNLSQELIDEEFQKAATGVDLGDQGRLNIGVLLGDPSKRLLDVDLDHYRTARLKDFFLPPTPARSGHAGKPNSHYWYIADEGTLPGTRQHLMPKGENNERGAVIVELRSTGAQTLIPPSIHDKTGELYTWSNGAWGGDRGVPVINGRRLAVQVALLALSVVLMDSWPQAGTRHEAYLALAGGLLRDGDQVHPYWEQNAAVLIRALAEATMDDDGPDAREAESIHTTIKNLKNGKPTTGFGKLAEILGSRVVDQVRVLIGEVESAAGVTSRQAPIPSIAPASTTSPAAAEAALRLDEARTARDEAVAQIDELERDPLEERLGTWEPIDIDPYLTGRVRPVMPSVLEREDGQHLMYPGRVNMLYGSSESAKSWIALYTCMQEMAKGQRALYLDFEDEPVNTLSRLLLMGANPDDLRFLFTYVRPEEPLQPMQMNRWGQVNATEEGRRNWEIFQRALEQADPSLIVADGMTVLYGLHGLDTNDASSTEIITGWLKRLTRNGRSTVILIDHTSKGAERGMTPIGSQHKQAMVQGTMLQVWPVKQPMPGQLGEVELIVLKDRPGQVRAASAKTGQKMQSTARIIIDSTQPGVTNLSIKPPLDPGAAAASGVVDLQASRAAAVAQRHKDVEDAIKWLYKGELGKQLSIKDILLGTQISEKETRGAVERLVDQGWLEPVGATKNRVYELKIGGAGYDVSIDLSNLTD